MKSRVASFLIRRNNISDVDLISNVWYHDLINSGMEKDEAIRILKVLNVSALTNPETIRRSRQKLQEDEPETYGHPDTKKGEEIKQSIKDF